MLAAEDMVKFEFPGSVERIKIWSPHEARSKRANSEADISPGKSEQKQMLSHSVTWLIDGDLGHWTWKASLCFEYRQCYAICL